jgi:NAD(P)H-dependent FMN reductase
LKTLKLLALNGSVRGDDGDAAEAMKAALAFAGDVDVAPVTLATYRGTVEAMVRLLTDADAILVATGTYWGSWGSPLQRFLEVMTPLEATPAFLGKPAACVVTMDSVGGVDVGTRLLGALGTMGCATAPFPLVVLSRVGFAVQGREGFDDVWQPRDLEVTVTNLVTHARATRDTRSTAHQSWTVDKGRMPTGPWPATGALDLGLPRMK